MTHFYNKNLAIGQSIKFSEEFDKDFVVVYRNNEKYQILALEDLLIKDLSKIVYSNFLKKS